MFIRWAMMRLRGQRLYLKWDAKFLFCTACRREITEIDSYRERHDNLREKEVHIAR